MLGGCFSPAVCLGLPVGTDMSALGFQISLGVTPYKVHCCPLRTSPVIS